MITAERVYKEIIEMPVKERERLFAVIARQGFEKDLYTHNEVFDDIRQMPFTIREAAEITIRRWVKKGVLKAKKVGKNIVFGVDDIKTFKKLRRREEKVLQT